MEIFDINPVVVLEFLTPEECEQLLNYFHAGQKASGRLRPKDRRLTSDENDPPNSKMIRNNTICWLDQTESTTWIYNKISDLLNEMNESKYHFSVDGLQAIQLAEYKSTTEEGAQFYKSHIDSCTRGWNNGQRKLSLSIQLTPQQDYEGGDLLLFGDKNDMIMDPSNLETNLRQRRGFGAAVIFPSFFEHEVTPVTKGTRYALVAWMQGPNWK